VNHELEDKLSVTLEQIKEQGLLSELACQVTSPSPHIETYLSKQLEQLQTKNEELEVANSTLRGQLDELQKKCGDLITLVEQTSVVRDDLQSFTELLEMQIQEISGEKAKSVKLKDLHTELLSSFMGKSQQVCSDLHQQIKKLEVS
jgi:predicted transcriptional regulator